MKKILVLILLFVFISISNNSNAQLPNQGTYLLKNLNAHFTNTLYSAVWGYKAPNGREYAILGCPSGTAFIDITDSANIREVDFQTGLTSAWREMKTYSHYAYIVSEANNSKLQIVDLQYLPDSVHLVKTWSYTGYTHTHSISQSGNYLYLNGGDATPSGGIAVVNVIDPENPVKLGQWNTLYVHDCRVVNDTIYAANINEGKVSIINATNKSSLTNIVTFSNLINSGPHNTALSNNKKRLFVTDEIGSAPFLLKVWNIENRSSPVYVTSWQPTGITTSIVHNIETYGDYGIVAHYTAGIRIINISNPDSPQEVAWYDTYPSSNASGYNGCWGVYMFPSGKIVASDRQTGLYVIKTNFIITGVQNTNTVNSVPDKYELSQNYPNPFNPSTNLEFAIPRDERRETQDVKLVVYNALGKVIQTLVNEKKNAGSYKVEFNGNNLSSGTYFYSLSVNGNIVSTKSMILLK